MSLARIKLKYPELAKMLEEETNKRKVEVKGHPIAVEQLSISKDLNQLIISADIKSKWNASFQLKVSPIYLTNETRLELNDLAIHFHAKNLLFKGILNVVKGNILKRIEKMAEEPLADQLVLVQKLIDKELSKSKLPHSLILKSTTKSLEIKKLEFNKDHVFIEVKLDQLLQIEFKDSEIETSVA